MEEFYALLVLIISITTGTTWIRQMSCGHRPEFLRIEPLRQMQFQVSHPQRQHHQHHRSHREDSLMQCHQLFQVLLSLSQPQQELVSTSVDIVLTRQELREAFVHVNFAFLKLTASGDWSEAGDLQCHGCDSDR